MAFDLGTLIRAAALGGSAYQQSRRDEEDRTRQQQREDDETARRKKDDERQATKDEQDAAEAILRQEALRIANKRNQTPPPVPPRYRANVEGVTYEGDDIGEIIGTAGKIRANTPPDSPSPQRPKTPAEIEEEELRLRILRANASGAERDNEIEVAQPTADARLGAGVLTGTVGGARPDPNDPMRDLDMRAIIERNALIQHLIHNEGLTPQEAEREARRRLGS